MTLPNLAEPADLSARGVTVTDDDLTTVMLAVASAVVRGAAQSPITETTSQVTLIVAETGPWLELPGGPVQSVSDVAIDGEPVDPSAYKLLGDRLWLRAANWCDGVEPVNVTLSITHGLPVVPPEIKHLVVDLAISGLNAASDGARTPGVLVESIDDYSVTFAQGADMVSSVMELPSTTKRALRVRFGGGARVVTSL